MIHHASIPLGFIRTAIASEHITAIRTGDDTHAPCLKFAGQLVRHTLDENLITRAITCFLPAGYEGDSPEQIAGMVRDAIKKGFHEKKPKRQRPDSQSQLCLTIVQERGVHLFHNTLHDGFISVPWGEGGTRTFRLKSQNAEQWLRRIFYETTGRPIAAQAVKDTIETLDATALFDGPLEAVAVRITKAADRIYIDLGSEDGAVVEVTPEAWSVVSEAPVRFLRPSGFGVLPVPESGGDLNDLKQLLSLDDGNWVLFLAFVLNCLKADGPFLCLMVEGEQGSGKSLLCELLKRLLDPSAAPKLRLPRDEHNLMIQASQNALLVFDNVSGVKWDISDALCSLSTGSGFSTRKFYTDDDARIFQLCRPYVLNGIGEYASRPDLLERSISLKLPPIPPGNRRTEQNIWDHFQQNHARWLGRLLDIVVIALRQYEKVEAPTSIRMADAARWLTAAEPATGLPKGTFILTLQGAQHSLMADRIANQPLTQALLNVVKFNQFEGTIGELHDRLTNDTKHGRALPEKTAAHLSSALARARPALETIGIHISFGKRTRKGRMITITADEYEKLGDHI
jgi:hypothetical protein